jgi:hypothetical protein
MSEVGSWRDRAACRDSVTADHDPFFADTVDGQLKALAICETGLRLTSCPTSGF